jgi:hypothetical protein
VFDCFQIPYSALERQHEELIQAAVDFGAGVIVRGAVARGEPGASLGKERRWAWEAAGLDDLLEQGEARTGSACGAYCPVGRSHRKRGSVSFGHTLCRHQSYGDDSLDCTAVASLCMAEVALGLKPLDPVPDQVGAVTRQRRLRGSRHDQGRARARSRSEPVPLARLEG